MIEKPKRPKKPNIQERQPPRTLQELINRYDLDNTKVYDFLDELVGQINDKNIITIGLNTDTSTTSTSAYQGIDLSLTKEISKVGTKLSLSNGKVLIGSGVTKVLVSGKLQTQGDNSAYGLLIKKNNTEISNNYEGNQGASWSQLTASPILASVTEGDTIKMSVYHNVTNATKNIKAYSGYGTYLTVEVIE